MSSSTDRREPIHIDSTLVDMIEPMAPGVIGYTVEDDEGLWVPFVYAINEGNGDVGRFLDGLPSDRTVFVPNVLCSRLAGMLARRGFIEEDLVLTADEMAGLDAAASALAGREVITTYARRP